MICEYERAYIMNCSLHNVTFPKEWKRSIITPIPKGGDKLNPENWCISIVAIGPSVVHYIY